MSTPPSKPRPTYRKRVFNTLAAGFVFGIVGYGVGAWLAKAFPGGPSLEELGTGWSDILAALVAFALVIGAVAVLFVSLDRSRLSRMYGLDEPASDIEVAQARLQSLVIGLSGVLMVAPMAITLADVAPAIGLGAIVLLLILHTVLNVRAYRQMDELFKRTVHETVFATFFLGQGLLFLWAVAERLWAAPSLSSWDVYVLLMTLYLAASTIITIRRGLA